MSANPRDIPTMRMVVGSTSERYNPTGDISYGLIRYNTTDNNVEAYAKDGWVNLQGGSGTDASFDRIGEYTNNSGITFLSDVSVNGVLNSTDGSFSGNLYSASGIIGGAGGWILGANGSSNYTFTGSGLTGSEANPTLNLFRGNKYIFINNTGGHPFQISNSDNTAYGSGVTNNGGAGGSTITFEVPYDAPKTLKYICTAHSGAMNGVINIHGGGSAVDASFQSDVTIGGNLYVDGSFNFGEVIKNITTVNNELLISTQVDISNHGTGPALSVTQHGDGAADNLVLLHAGTDGSAVEVKGDGRSIFYKDVSINTQLSVPDASFNRIQPIDGSLVVMGDLSVNGQIFSSGGLVGGGGGGSGTDASFDVIDDFTDGSGVTFLTDVSINGVLKNDGFTDLSNKVFLNTVTTTFNTGTIVDLSDVVTAMSTKFTADDASFYRIAPIDGSLVLIGDLSVNGNIFSSGGIVGGGGGGGSGTDASFNVIGEFMDGSGVTFISDVSINSQLSVPDASINNINAVDGSIVTIEQVLLSNNNVTAHAIKGANYYLGESPMISNTKQANFTDIELKQHNNPNATTVLMYGDTGNIETTGIIKVDTIDDYTDGSGVTIDSVLIKNNNVTAHAIKGANYYLGESPMISNTKQANFTDIELKQHNNPNATTVLMYGDTGNIETTGIIKVDTIDDYTDGSGVTFMTDVSINEGLSAVDASFQNDITVGGNLYVDGSFNFGEVIKNITTVNNEILISTQVDISNVGTGPALRVAQFGDTAGDKLAVFDATGPDGVALEIMHDGDSVFYKDVSFHKNVVVRDASFINDVDVDGTLLAKDDVSFNKHLSVLDASFQNDVDIYGKLVLSGDISINGELNYSGFTDLSNKVFLNTVTTTFNTGTIVDLSDTVTAMSTQFTTQDASFQNDVDVEGKLVVKDDVSLNTHLTVPDASFGQIGPTDNSLIVMGDLSINGDIVAHNVKNIKKYQLFDDVTSSGGNPGNPFWTTSSNVPTTIEEGTIIIHNIKVSSRLKTGYIDFPDGGHEYILKRTSSGGSVETIDSFYHNFISQDVFEEATHTYIEKIDSQYSYTNWRVDISGDGIKNDNLNKLTWDITEFSPKLLSTAPPSTVRSITLFDSSSGTSGSWNKNENFFIPGGSIVIHDIKVSGFVSSGYVDWPSSGHEFIFQHRYIGDDGGLSWNGVKSYEHVKHIFDAQNVHEEQDYTILEPKTSADRTYTSWHCDLSGDKGTVDSNDALTWKITALTPSDYNHVNDYSYGQFIPAGMLTGAISNGLIPKDMSEYLQTGSPSGSISQDVYGQKTFKDVLTVDNSLNVDGNLTVDGVVSTKEIRAKDSNGLKLYNDAGSDGLSVNDNGTSNFSKGISVLSGSTSNTTDDEFCLVANANNISGASCAKISLRRDNGNYYGAELLGGLPITGSTAPDGLENNERFAINTVGDGTRRRAISINNLGNVGIGDTTPSQKLQVAGSAYIDTNLHVNNYIRPGSNNYLKWLASDSGGIHRWHFDWYSGTTSQLEFLNLAGDNNCNIKAKSYQNISDDRVKTNETPILNATDTIKKLNPVTYDYYGNFDCSGDSNVSAGLVGQEVWYNAPELRFIINPALDASLNHDISANDDWGTDALGINYSELIPYLIKSNQEQQTEIEELKTRLAALENIS